MPPTTEVKILGETKSGFTLGGYGVVWGGADLVGDYFEPDTDFWFDRLSRTPMVLYQHGQDGMLKRTVVGKVTTIRPDDVGLWIEAQISAAKEYADAIRKVATKGALGWSSGAVPHLVERIKGTAKGTFKLVSWPIAEWSLTPTPAEPRTVGIRELKSLAEVDLALKPLADSLKQVEGSYEDLREDICEAAGELLGGGYCLVIATFSDYAIVSNDGEHYWRIPYTLDSDGDPVLGTPEPVEMTFAAASRPTSKATLTSGARNNLSGSDFAYIDSDGGRHLPINDEAHVRAALSRFSQTSFESTEKKRQAARKIMARARSMGIDVADDSAVAQAAGGGQKSMHDLPDDAFAYIAPGGTLDDSGLTTPRANRHFPHHDEDGNVDPALLAAALAESTKSDLGEHVRSHLLRHAQAVEAKAFDDAHSKFWSDTSAAGQLLVIGQDILDLAESAVVDQKSMEHLGYQQTNQRIRPEPLQRLKELKAQLEAVIAHAQQAEEGDDGTARAEYLRRRLALLEV